MAARTICVERILVMARRNTRYFIATHPCITMKLNEIPDQPNAAPWRRRSRSMQIAMGLVTKPAESAESAESCLLEIIIGFDDFTQLIFRAPVAAIGIGMVALHQLFKPGLNLGTSDAVLQT